MKCNFFRSNNGIQFEIFENNGTVLFESRFYKSEQDILTAFQKNNLERLEDGAQYFELLNKIKLEDEK